MMLAKTILWIFLRPALLADRTVQVGDLRRNQWALHEQFLEQHF